MFCTKNSVRWGSYFFLLLPEIVISEYGKKRQHLAINFTVKFIVVEDETGGKKTVALNKPVHVC